METRGDSFSFNCKGFSNFCLRWKSRVSILLLKTSWSGSKTEEEKEIWIIAFPSTGSDWITRLHEESSLQKLVVKTTVKPSRRGCVCDEDESASRRENWPSGWFLIRQIIILPPRQLVLDMFNGSTKEDASGANSFFFFLSQSGNKWSAMWVKCLFAMSALFQKSWFHLPQKNDFASTSPNAALQNAL